MITSPAQGTAGRRVIVGVGNRDRGDDAVGPSVCDRVRGLGTGIEDWVVEADPSTLAVRWRPEDRVVVVDAVVTGARPGTVHRLASAVLAGDGVVSTHGIGIADTIRLSMALGTCPHELAVLGVEAESFEHGRPLTAAVALSVDDAAVVAMGLLAAPPGSPSP